jgi:NAD(P)-dependent dehydrogenase (short-subunit alcohol dehydrogenase family)
VDGDWQPQQEGMPAATPETGRLGEGKRSVKVLVVGATGGLGQDVAAESLSRGHQTAALARDPSRAALPELMQIGLSVVTEQERTLIDLIAVRR